MIRARIHQFLDASRLPVSGDFALAELHLSPALLPLFLQQHPRDIVHSAATARWLLSRGHSEPDLIAAALLHDVGKGEQRRMDRVAHVVCQATGLGTMAACDRSRFKLRRALARSASHSERGSAMLARAGAPPRVVELTRLHHGPSTGDPVLALLQQADAAS